MSKNFTQYAFTPTVRKLQERFKSRKAYQRMEQSGDRYILGAAEASFIQSRTSFYLSTIGDSGWPYLQHRGGPVGFLKIIDATTLRFADYTGNRQYISTGNVIDNEKTCLFLMDYPKQQRLKIWAHANVQFAEDVPELAEQLSDENDPAKIERIFTLEIQGFDWNCPKYIDQRFTIEEIRNDPSLLTEAVK
jgi:predicted pyridoxine 5'-phosphate oxidase superfamily flavin-nucleotide-binding protein